MSNLQANRTLSGSFAEVWVDGARIAELSQLTLTVKVQREKVSSAWTWIPRSPATPERAP